MINEESSMIKRDISNDNREMSSRKLYIQELVVLLREFSKILSLANATNPELAQAVAKLANTLSKYKDKPVDEILGNIIIQKPRHPTGYILKTSKTISESEARDFTLEHIERLLDSERLSKSDLISIAAGRFGISKADLTKTKKDYVIDTLRTAISNLRTIEIIGKQASHTGR